MPPKTSIIMPQFEAMTGPKGIVVRNWRLYFQQIEQSLLGTPLSPSLGGTGVNNGSSTITLGGNLQFSGAFSTTITVTGITTVTLPTSGTLLQTTGSGSGLTFGTGSLALGGNLSLVGAFASIFNITGATNVTFPTSGTLLTTAGAISTAQVAARVSVRL